MQEGFFKVSSPELVEAIGSEGDRDKGNVAVVHRLQNNSKFFTTTYLNNTNNKFQQQLNFYQNKFKQQRCTWLIWLPIHLLSSIGEV
jgi:hypothetical protein